MHRASVPSAVHPCLLVGIAGRNLKRQAFFFAREVNSPAQFRNATDIRLVEGAGTRGSLKRD